MGNDTVPRSIARVLDLFEVVLDKRSCNLTEAAQATGLTPTTALRYLRALEARDYLRRDDAGVFRPGPVVQHLSTYGVDERPLERLIAVAQPQLDLLATTSGESTYLALRGDQVATYVAAADSIRAVRHVGEVGQEVTLSGSAVGDALEEPGTVATRTGAVEPDISAVSLALSPIGDLHVALSIVGPAHRISEMSLASLEAALRQAAAAIETELGVATAVLEPPGKTA